MISFSVLRQKSLDESRIEPASAKIGISQNPAM
jgi:hypothetical protein